MCLDRCFIAPQWARRVESGERAPAADIARYHGRTFPVVRVVDGDTLYINAPDGASSVTEVRLLGIDAPEMPRDAQKAMYYAERATRFARGLAQRKTVTLYVDEDGATRGKYGRLLAYAQLPDGTFLNEQLVAEGYAYADLRFPHSYYQKYRQLEAGARALDKGLWAECTREQLPAWLQRMRPDFTP